LVAAAKFVAMQPCLRMNLIDLLAIVGRGWLVDNLKFTDLAIVS
uniref:Uncharacterized protein n=1 Tax=Aegilops tauschii subsp. strangulata TaxID=200361 RepID=A0A453Q4S5_AEGTS